ncbi:MAG: BTAD domain-containing putative transcriptional regulator [Eubacteriales bacterium]
MANICIHFFGTFSISYGEHVISEDDNRSKKLWKLLEYIVVNRTRRIPQEELVQLLWDDAEEGENPLSSLKTMLHRVRNTLDRLEVMDSRKIILQKGGAYFWNNMLDYTTDADEFDELMYKIADDPDATDRILEYALRALDLYKGLFLGGKYSDCSWASEPCKRYHAAYVRTFETAVSILLTQRRYDDIIALSERAIAIDPTQEPFYYYLIRSHIEKGENLKALKLYEQVIDLFYNRLRQNPSDRLRILYRSIAKVTNGVEVDIGLINDRLSERDNSSQPLFVEYETFRYLYTAAKRMGKKMGSPYHLMLLTIHSTGSSYAMPMAKHQDRAISMLREMLCDHLHESDICTRYSVTQFLCAAHFDSDEEAQKVADSIVHDFKYANLAVRVEVSVKITRIE